MTTELSIADDIDASYVTVSPAKLRTTFRESLVSDRDGNFAANCSLMVLIKTIMTIGFQDKAPPDGSAIIVPR